MPDDLRDFPAPHVAVDLVLLTVEPSTDRLVTLVQERTSAPVGPVLPGRFIRERTTVRETIADLMRVKLDVSPAPDALEPRLLTVFDDPARDPRAWALSLAYAVALPWAMVAGANGSWLPVDEDGEVRGTRLLFDHAAILALAVRQMRDRYEVRPDPDRLLPEPFTLLDLRHLHEAVLGVRLAKDTFNRRMRSQLSTADTAPDEELSSPVIQGALLSITPRAMPPLGAPPRRRVGKPAQTYAHARGQSARPERLWRLPRAE